MALQAGEHVALLRLDALAMSADIRSARPRLVRRALELLGETRSRRETDHHRGDDNHAPQHHANSQVLLAPADIATMAAERDVFWAACGKGSNGTPEVKTYEVHARMVRHRAPASIASSAILPARVALLQEGAHAFVRIARHHVFGHHGRCIAIGVGETHLELPVEGFLADLERVCRLRSDPPGQRDRLVALDAGGDDAVDEADA